MNYLEAMEVALNGTKVRAKVMNPGEYIEYDKDEQRFYWWDANHDAHSSFPQDVSDEDYSSWLKCEWEACEKIRSDRDVRYDAAMEFMEKKFPNTAKAVMNFKAVLEKELVLNDFDIEIKPGFVEIKFRLI